MDINYLSWAKNLDDRFFGRDDIRLLWSSSVFEPTAMVIDHLRDFHAKADEYLAVSNAWGHSKLLEAIASRYRVEPANVITTNGASNGIYLTCRAHLKPGDHLIIESPCYEPLRASPAFIGADVSYLERHFPDYLIDLDQLDNLMRPDTRLIILTNLHNPSGTLVDDNQLLEIARITKAKNKNVKIVVDEIYHDFLPEIPHPVATLDDCFITLNSLTKVYGLGLLFCGWIIADNATIKRIRELQVVVEGSNSRLMHSFIAYIFRQLDTYHKRAIEHSKTNLEILSQFLQPLIDKGIISGQFPRYGCIYFPRFPHVDNTEMLVKRLADEYKIFVVPGRYFGQPQHIRIGFGGPTEKLKANLDVFVGAMQKIMASK
jgi:hypothetical protein